MHLKQLGLTYSACGSFTKNKEKIEKFMQTENTGFIYKFDNACSQHDIAHGKQKGLTKRTQSHKALRDKAFEIAKNPNNDAYPTGLASMVYKFFEKKSALLNLVEVLLNLCQIIKLKIYFIGASLENLRKENFIHLLEWGVDFWGQKI